MFTKLVFGRNQCAGGGFLGGMCEVGAMTCRWNRHGSVYIAGKLLPYTRRCDMDWAVQPKSRTVACSGVIAGCLHARHPRSVNRVCQSHDWRFRALHASARVTHIELHYDYFTQRQSAHAVGLCARWRKGPVPSHTTALLQTGRPSPANSVYIDQVIKSCVCCTHTPRVAEEDSDA